MTEIFCVYDTKCCCSILCEYHHFHGKGLYCMYAAAVISWQQNGGIVDRIAIWQMKVMVIKWRIENYVLYPVEQTVPAQSAPLEQYAYSLSVSYFSTHLSHWLCFIHRVSWGMRGTMPSFQPLKSLVAGSVSARFLRQICDKVEFF